METAGSQRQENFQRCGWSYWIKGRKNVSEGGSCSAGLEMRVDIETGGPVESMCDALESS